MIGILCNPLPYTTTEIFRIFRNTKFKIGQNSKVIQMLRISKLPKWSKLAEIQKCHTVTGYISDLNLWRNIIKMVKMKCIKFQNWPNFKILK